jgi:putative cardiolipin synthase
MAMKLLFCLHGLCLLLLGGCIAIDLARIDRPFSHALYDPADTGLAMGSRALVTDHPGLSGFRLIDSGREALSQRLELADQAEKTLDLQYYILRSDISGLLLVEHLLAAADRGVRVRILIDDLHFDQSGQPLLALDTHPNVEVRIINPFLYRYAPGLGRLFEVLSDFNRIQRRMHNKVYIADNTVALIGGRNLGDEYFEAHPRLDLRDIDLLAIGPVVPQLSTSFDSYWNYKQTLPVSTLATHRSDTYLQDLRILLKNHKQHPDVAIYLQYLADNLVNPMPQVWARGQVLADFPCKLAPDQPDCASLHFDRFYNLFRLTTSELLIISPYFIPGKEGIALFHQLRQKGISVKILTNSYAATDLKVVQAGYSRYRLPLLAEDVELFEFKPTFVSPLPQRKKSAGFTGSSQACMHAKAYVIDRQRVFVGSFNHDPRSATLNTEVGILVESPELAQQMAALFERYTQPHNSYRLQLGTGKNNQKKLQWQTEEEGNRRVYQQEPMISWWQHVKNALMAAFAPEDLL